MGFRHKGYRHGWLLWLAVGAVACLPPLSVAPLVALGVAAILGFCWVFLNVSLRHMFISLMYSILDIFFREFVARNQVKVPPEGAPCIFVCAPHANQFLDPFVVMYGVARSDVAFLAAAKSMRKRLVGSLARLLRSIPVERAQDLAFHGAGTVWLSPEDGVSLQGRGTRFTEQLHAGDTVAWRGASARVASVDSDERCTLRTPTPPPTDEWCAFRVLPHVDQSAMFSEVYSALFAGKAVGIFPEGGSHDQPSLLPLKAGIGIMALGALSRHPGMPLQLVPVGLNYFSGHRFRSRVFLDIGEPFSVPAELVSLYAEGGQAKHEATTRLMNLVEDQLGAVTVSASDYETLEFFWTLRRLTCNSAAEGEARRPMALGQQLAFVRKFSHGYDSLLEDGTPLKDSPPVQRIRRLCAAYNDQLKAIGMRDYQVAYVLDELSRARALARLVSRALLLLFYMLLLIPGVIFLPVLVCTRTVSAIKAAQAKKGSSVKLKGRDVLATWKLMVSIVLFPLLYVVLTLAVGRLACCWARLPPPWGLETTLLFFFAFPFLAYGALKAGENLVRVARSIPPLFNTALRPSYISHIVEQRAALKNAMQGLVDEQGWVLGTSVGDLATLDARAAHADAAAADGAAAADDGGRSKQEEESLLESLHTSSRTAAG